MRAERWLLPSLLLILGALHLGFRAAQPPPQLWGDEGHYFGYAHLDALEGRTGLLPGGLRFDHRPELEARVGALFAERVTSEAELVQRASELQSRHLERMSLVHLALFLATVATLYGAARWLGLGAFGAFSASALYAFCPAVAFHVHTLWSEVLHGFLFSVVVLGWAGYARRRRTAWLLLSGAAAGYALLAKGVLNPFVPIATAFLAVDAWRQAAGARPLRRLLRGLGAASAFLLPLLLVVVPQLQQNAAAGHGWRLAANRWWNLELGLTIPAETLASTNPERWKALQETSLAYFAAAEAPPERERLAHERTREFYRAQRLDTLLFHQAQKLFDLLVRGSSTFEQSLGFRERWGPAPPAWMRSAALPGRLLWYALLVLGLAGFIGRRTRDPAWVLLALFTLYFFTALLLVPIKLRFALPATLPLALFSGWTLTWLRDRARGRSRP